MIRSKWFIIGALALVGAILIPLSARAAVCNGVAPRGTLPPTVEEWCFEPLNTTVNSTHVEGVNSWVDDFNHGQSHTEFGGAGDAYVTGSVNTPDAIFFRHANHWMVDQQGPTSEGHVWARPARTFHRQADGSLVVEFEVADAAYGGEEFDSKVWPEITVSTLGATTSNGLYTYNAFNGGNNFGCRLQRYGFPICEYNIGGGRVYEASFFQTSHADDSYGGGPFNELSNVWKYCETTENPDAVCRNVFRLTLTSTSFRLDVNGVKYFEQTGVPNMDALLNQNMYVYMSQSLWQAPADVFRSHWDHFAVNPGDATPPPPPPTPVPTSECRVQWNTPGTTSYETLHTVTLTRDECLALGN